MKKEISSSNQSSCSSMFSFTFKSCGKSSPVIPKKQKVMPQLLTQKPPTVNYTGLMNERYLKTV
jgi:hypothetical protein